jgi:putative membrane-bound dehydrogenase-like protein
MKSGLFLIVLLAGSRLLAADAPSATPVSKTNAVSKTNSKTVMPPRHAEALDNFELKRGFRLEVVAQQPLVTDPIAMTFDANNRLFVAEKGEEAGGGLQLGRLRLLEDDDGNGVFDISTIYAENLTNTTALICYNGGIFVGAGGQILYLKDTNNDGVADIRREVFNSFGDSADGTGGQVVISAMAWGLDNRIHVATTGRGGDVISSRSPAQSVVLSGGSFSFDPRTYLLSGESGSGASGLSFDDRGRRFICTPSNHLEMVMYDSRYAARNPLYTMTPGPVLDLTRDDAENLIYPISPRRPDGGFLPLRSKTSPPSSRYAVPLLDYPRHFMSAGGLVIYRGNAFPPGYVGDAFVADAFANLVHHDQLRQQGIFVTASRAGDEIGAEFLASRDWLFQPSQIINAPDGALYVAGPMPFFPTPVNPAAANAAPKVPPERGRIYRIVPANFKQPKLPVLAKAPTSELVVMLRHPNGWYRDTAARLLYERQDRASVVPLIGLLFNSQMPSLARMHAFLALAGLQISADGQPGRALMEPHVVKALLDLDDRVREHGVLLAETFIAPDGTISDRLWSQLSNMGGDPSPQVRYQLAFTLGQIRHAGRLQILAEILRADPANPWVQSAVLSSLSEGAPEMFGLLINDGNFSASTNGQDFLSQLLSIAGAKAQPAEVKQLVREVQGIADARLAFTFVRALDNALQRGGSSLSAADSGSAFAPLYNRALHIALDQDADDSLRKLAFGLLGATAVVDPAFSAGVIKEWPLLRPGVRLAAMDAMLARPERAAAILTAIKFGTIPAADLSWIQIIFLREHPDSNLHQAAAVFLGQVVNNSGREAVSRFLPSLRMAGSAGRGREIFQAHCAACHVIGKIGNPLGVPLTAANTTNKQDVLIKILDPHRNPPVDYPATVIQTSDGESVIGFIAAQNSVSLRLCDAAGDERDFALANIVSQQNLGISIMSGGLGATLSQQGMANLLEFVSSAQK